MSKVRAGNLMSGWSFLVGLGAVVLLTPSACNSSSSDDDDAKGGSSAHGGHGSIAGEAGSAAEGGAPIAGQPGTGGKGAGGKSGASSGGSENATAGASEGGSPNTGGAPIVSDAGSGNNGNGGSTGGASSAGVIEMFDDAFGMTLARDVNGTLHVAATARVSGIYSIVYATCASSCAQSDSWTAVPLGLQSTTSQIPTIGLTGTGLPRIYAASDDDATKGYHYLSCDAECDQVASWHDLRLNNVFPQPTIVPPPSLPFAVSPSGAAVAVRSDDSSMTALYCAGSCEDGTSWTSLGLGGNYTYPASVAFGVDESITLVGRHLVRDDQLLFWIGCDGDCQDVANWKGLDGLLTIPGQIDMSVARSSSGGTRVMAYFDDPSTSAIDHIFSMLTCDSDCSNSDNWSVLSPLPIPPQSATIGFAFALNASDEPVIAYLNEVASGYASCSGDCTSPSGVWQGVDSISSDYLNGAVPPPVPATCNMGTWQMYTGPAFALDAQGQPVIGVTGRAIALGGECGSGSDSTMTSSFLVVPE